MTTTQPAVLLEHYLEQLKLPTIVRGYARLAAVCTQDRSDYATCLLRLLERHPLVRLTEAVEHGLRVRAHTRDAIAQFLLPREDWRATTFSLDGREHLRRVVVRATEVSAYRDLLPIGGAP